MILALIIAAISVTPAYTNVNRAGGSKIMTNIEQWAPAVEAAIATKQTNLVSGVNIKTINGDSILGNGNLVIEGGGGTVTPSQVTNIASSASVTNAGAVAAATNAAAMAARSKTDLETYTLGYSPWVCEDIDLKYSPTNMRWENGEKYLYFSSSSWLWTYYAGEGEEGGEEEIYWGESESEYGDDLYLELDGDYGTKRLRRQSIKSVQPTGDCLIPSNTVVSIIPSAATNRLEKSNGEGGKIYWESDGDALVVEGYGIRLKSDSSLYLGANAVIGTDSSAAILPDNISGWVFQGKSDSAERATVSDSADYVDWDDVDNTPETLLGYGITDAYTKTAVDANFLGKTAKAADADRLDGQDSAYFATTSSLSGYLPLSGGYDKAITGPLMFKWNGHGAGSIIGKARGSEYLLAIESWTGNRIEFANDDYESYITPDGTNVLTANLATNTFPIVTNAYTKTEVDALADYALTNLTGAAVTLRSGEIGNATLTADTSVTLDFTTAANRSGDCLLYAINNDPTNDFDLIPTDTNAYTFVSTDLTKALTIGKATTNIVTFTRLKADTVLIMKQEVK